MRVGTHTFYSLNEEDKKKFKFARFPSSIDYYICDECGIIGLTDISDIMYISAVSIIERIRADSISCNDFIVREIIK